MSLTTVSYLDARRKWRFDFYGRATNHFPMTEVLLRPNRRALLLGLVFPAAEMAIGVALLSFSRDTWWSRLPGTLIIVLGALKLIALVDQWRWPRLAVRNGALLVGLRLGSTIRMPLEVTECAFLGRGPGDIPGRGEKEIKIANLVVRLDQRATEWAKRDVWPAFGTWTDGYITIRGAWCEPLTLEVVQHINQRLHELKLQASQAQTKSLEHS
jgi:hypothetical protein